MPRLIRGMALFVGILNYSFFLSSLCVQAGTEPHACPKYKGAEEVNARPKSGQYQSTHARGMHGLCFIEMNFGQYKNLIIYLFLTQQRTRLCAMIAERTGEKIPPFVPIKVLATVQCSGGQLQEFDPAMQRVEANREAPGKDQKSAEELWNIGYIFAPYIILCYIMLYLLETNVVI
jgi:hypothetical protein